MAPRRGGGSGGVSSYGGDDGDSDPSLWTELIQLFGFHFKNRYIMAQIVFVAIALFALVVIAIWALSLKKHAQASRTVFKWYRFGTAATVALVVFAFRFADLIITENETVVAVVYFLIQTIFLSFFYLAEIAILLTIYAVVVHLLQHRKSGNQAAYRGIKWMHGIFCAILFVIFVAMLSLRISVVVISVEDGAYSSFLYYTGFTSSLVELQSSITKLAVAYNVLYMCFSLEIMILAGIVLISSLRQRNSKIDAAVLVAAVSFPLLLRSLIEAAFSIAYDLEGNYRTASGVVAEAFFYYFCTVVVYAGVVFLGGRFAKNLTNPEAAPTAGPLVNESQPSWKPDMMAGVGQTPQYYPKYGGTMSTAGPNGNTSPYSYYPNR